MTIPLKFTVLGCSYFTWRYCCPHTVAEIAGGVFLVGLTTISANSNTEGPDTFGQARPAPRCLYRHTPQSNARLGV